MFFVVAPQFLSALCGGPRRAANDGPVAYVQQRAIGVPGRISQPRNDHDQPQERGGETDQCEYHDRCRPQGHGRLVTQYGVNVRHHCSDNIQYFGVRLKLLAGLPGFYSDSICLERFHRQTENPRAGKSGRLSHAWSNRR